MVVARFLLPAAMKVAIVCDGKVLLGTPTAMLAAVLVLLLMLLTILLLLLLLLLLMLLLMLPSTTLAAVVDESMKPLRLPVGSAAPNALYKS